MKITTAVCKQELDANLPEAYGKSTRGWKRVSKRGATATQIVRVFQHRELPVTGTVIESDGEIVSCSFAAVSDEEDFDKPVSNEYFSADQLYFAFVSDQEDGITRLAICQISFWSKNKHLSDNVNKRTMEGLLPDSLQESSESFFESTLSEAQVRKALKARGFQEDVDFERFVANIF